MHELAGIEIRADKNEILEKLHANRERHSVIVSEARKGYVEKAREKLRERLDQLESGKVVSLSFHLEPPQDHTAVYDTAIEMLTLSTEPHVKLSSTQVRNLVMDKWDWSGSFTSTRNTRTPRVSSYEGQLRRGLARLPAYPRASLDARRDPGRDRAVVRVLPCGAQGLDR